MIERRKTNQRQWVLETVKQLGHLSAQDTYEQIRADHPEISVATVYRNLNVLMESGLVQVVSHTSQKEIYDARTDSHAHFICRECGQIFDIEESYSLTMARQIELSGHQVDEIKSTVFGCCAPCRVQQS